jgi:hypothetical protein
VARGSARARWLQQQLDVSGDDARVAPGETVELMRKFCVNTLFNLCRVSRARQEMAALAGAVGALKGLVMDHRSSLWTFAAPVLTDLVSAGPVAREAMWQHGGLWLLWVMLRRGYWATRALVALNHWVLDERSSSSAASAPTGPDVGSAQSPAQAARPGGARLALLVRDLLSPPFVAALVGCLRTPQDADLGMALSPLNQLAASVPGLAAALARAFALPAALARWPHGDAARQQQLLDLLTTVLTPLAQEAAASAAGGGAAADVGVTSEHEALLGAALAGAKAEGKVVLEQRVTRVLELLRPFVRRARA